jgi:pSer/pThr/pTyr-binding forkhead associated (FHA) protein
VLGRSKEFGGLFDSPTISRRHARIVVGGASAAIEDLGSKNGTFVNGARVAGPVTLQHGDTVRLGNATVIFCAGGSERPTQSLSEEQAAARAVAHQSQTCQPARRPAYRTTTSLGSAGALAGGNRRWVACSNAYASPIKRGSLNARPENVTPAGPSFALKPSGNGGSTTF